MGKLQILYHAVVADEIECAHKIYGCCLPCTCMCWGPLSKALRESTYVQVLENRIEYNYPHSFLTPRLNCSVVDNTRVIYFDRAIIMNAQVAECCSPSCTHNRMFPTCCGLEGQAVVLFEDRVMGCEGLCTCCHVYNSAVDAGQLPRCLTCLVCSTPHVILPCIRDAAGLAKAINTARDARVKHPQYPITVEMER